jgi:hypothetical protein
MKLSRREFAGATVVTPLAAIPTLQPTRPVAAAAGTTEPASVWDIGAKPGYKLVVAAQEVELFGHKIRALLVNGAWPGHDDSLQQG